MKIGTSVTAALIAAGTLVMAAPALAQHGGGGGDVDTSALPPIEDGKWLEENPYRGSKEAIKVGKAAYDGQCARCHGIDMISGGIAPDLRELGEQYDEYFINKVRNGVQRNGVTYMPGFEDIYDQQTMWAIRSYVDKRHYEYDDKNLDDLYQQWQGEQSGGGGEGSKGDSGDDTAMQQGGGDEPAAVQTAAAANEAADDGEPDRLQQIKSSGAVEIAVYNQFPPWSYQAEEGGYRGIDVDIGEALAERLGVGLNLRTFTADESMGDDIRNQVWKGHYLGGGPADAMLHVGMAQPFQDANDQATFTGAYYNETMGFAYNAKRLGGSVDSPLGLAGHPIGVALDTLGDYFLTSAYQGRLRNDVEHFDSVPAAMRALNDGRIAAVMAPVGELSGAAHMLEEKDITMRTVRLTGIYQTDWNVGVAIKAGNPELASAIGDAMQAMRADGTIKAIFERYGVPYREPQAANESEATTASR